MINNYLIKRKDFFNKNPFRLLAPDGGNADATVFQSGDSIILAFRGTEFDEGDQNYWFQISAFYDLFEPLFQALEQYISNQSRVGKPQCQLN